MRLSTVFIILILSLGVVHAQGVLLSTDDLTEGQTIYTADGVYPFTLTISSHNGGEKIVLKTEVPDGNVTRDYVIWLDDEECELFEFTRFCFTDSTNTSGSWVATVSRYSIAPNIDLTISSSDQDIYVGQDATFTVTVNNNGSSDAKDVMVAIALPQGFEVIDRPSLLVNATHLYQDLESISSDDTYTYTVTGRIHEIGEFFVNVSVAYNDSFGVWREVTDDPLSFNTTEYFNYSTELSTFTLGIDEEMNFTVFLQNNQTSEDVNVTELRIEYPPSIRLVETDRINEDREGLLTYKKDFTYNASRLLKMVFLGTFPGSYNLSFYLEYSQSSLDTVLTKIRREFAFIVTGKNPLLISSLTSANKSYYTSGEIPFSLQVVNPYQTTPLTVRKVWLSINDEVSSFPSGMGINAQETRLILNSTIAIPTVTEDQEFSIDAVVEVGAEGFEPQNLTENHTLVVGKEILDINVILDPPTLYSGERVNVTVMVSNPTKHTYEDISVSDLSEFIVSDNTSTVFSLAPGESIQAYSYIAIVPFVFEDTNISHATLVEVNFEGKERIYFNQSTFLVNAQLEDNTSALPFDVKEQGQTGTVLLGGEDTEFEDQSFFSSVWFWSIVGLLVIAAGLAGMLIVRGRGDTEETIALVPNAKESNSGLPQKPSMDEVSQAIDSVSKTEKK